MEAPMLLDEKVVGALLVWRNDVSPFDEREQAIVSAFAVQAAMAVSNVNLVQQLEVLGAPSPPRRSRSSKRCARSARPSAPASTSTMCCRLHSDARGRALWTPTAVSIMEYSEQDRSFLVRSVYRDRPRASSGASRSIRIGIDDTLVGRAAKERRPIAVSDLCRHRPRSPPANPLRGRLAVGRRRRRCCVRARPSVSLIVPSEIGPETSRMRRSSSSRRSPASPLWPCSTPSCTAS